MIENTGGDNLEISRKSADIIGQSTKLNMK